MALGEIGATDQVEALLTFLPSPDWMLRRRLAEALGNLPHPQSQAALHHLCADPQPQVAEAAALALANLTKLTQSGN